MFTTALVQTTLVVSALVSPPGSPVAGVQALLMRLIATLAALWACAPSTPLRLLLERALRLTRPMLLDPEVLAPCSSWLDPVLLRLQLDQLHQALTWEARGLPGWTALDLTLRELSRALEVEQARGAS
jgi:hypothetical protein